MYYNQSFDEMPEDMLLHGKLINDGGHNLFQRDPPPSFRKKRRRKYVDKEVEVDDSLFENAKQAVAPKEVKKDEIEESQHPLRDASFFYGLSHGLKIARQLSIFTPVCGLVPPFRVPW